MALSDSTIRVMERMLAGSRDTASIQPLDKWSQFTIPAHIGEVSTLTVTLLRDVMEPHSESGSMLEQEIRNLRNAVHYMHTSKSTLLPSEKMSVIDAAMDMARTDIPPDVLNRARHDALYEMSPVAQKYVLFQMMRCPLQIYMEQFLHDTQLWHKGSGKCAKVAKGDRSIYGNSRVVQSCVESTDQRVFNLVKLFLGLLSAGAMLSALGEIAFIVTLIARGVGYLQTLSNLSGDEKQAMLSNAIKLFIERSNLVDDVKKAIWDIYCLAGPHIIQAFVWLGRGMRKCSHWFCLKCIFRRPGKKKIPSMSVV